MPNELGIKVKVNLDTSEQALRDQMKGVQSYFNKDPVKIAFAPDKTKTRSNINQVLRDMTSGKEGVQITVPEITLKFKVNGKEVGTQIKAALQEATNSAFSGNSKGGKDITSNLKKQLDGIVKEYSNTQKKISSLSKAQIGVDQNSDYYIELQRQIDKAKEAYASLRAEFAKDFPNSIEELAKQEAKLNEELKDKQALEALKQQYNQLNANSSVYDSTSVKIERLTAQIDYQRKVLEEYKNVGIDTSYANTLVEGFDKFNTGESGKALDDATKLRALQDAATSLNSEMARLAKQYSDVTTKQQNVAKSANNLAGELTRILQDNPRIRDNTELYSNFVDVIDRLNNVDVKDQQGFAKLQVRAANLKSEFIQLGLNTDTLYTKLSRLFTEHFQTALVMAGIHGIQQGLQEVIANVSNLDRSMTELRKVTDETENTYNQFLDGAAEKARELGTSIADYVDSTANLAQAGYSMDEADYLSYVSTMYKNVGDGIDSAATASEYLISTLKAFNIEATDSMHVLDAVNKVSNEQAVSAQDLGEMLTRSSAAMAEANNTFEETIALGTASMEITRNAESTGTMLRTLSMRLRGAKTEMEEAGEDTEGMASSVSELREELLALTGGQVDIMLNEDTFKGTYQIMEDLAGVWDELSDISQANILELVAGKQRGQAVAAILENWQAAEDSLEAALDSTGSAVQENERYLDSIAGKTAQLKAAFEQLSNTLLDSGVIKFFLDLGIGATDAANALAELTGVLPILATGLSSVGLLKGGMAGGLSAFATFGANLDNIKDAASQMAAVSESGRALSSVFQNIFGDKILLNSADGVTKFTDSLKGLTEQEQIAALSFVKFDGGSKQATQALIEQASATLGLSTATVGATAAQQAFNVALGVGKTLLAGLGIGLVVAGIQGLVGIINDVVHAQERNNEAMEDSINKLQETQSNLDTYNEQLEENGKRIAELEALDTLSITDEKDLENLKQENKLLEAQLAIEQQRLEVDREQAEEATKKATRTYNQNKQSIGVSIDDVEAIGVGTDNYAAVMASDGLAGMLASYKQLVALQKQATDPEDIIAYNSQIVDMKDSILSVVEELQGYQDVLNEIGYDNLSEEGKAAFDGIQESIETTLSYLDKTYYFNIKINADEFEKERQEILDYAQSMGADTMEVAVALLDTKNWSDNTNEFIKQMMEMGATAYQIADMIGANFDDIVDSIGETSPELTKLNEKLDEVQGAYQTVRTAIDEYNEYGLISADTLQELNTLSPEYTACLYDENGQLLINQDTLANTQKSYADVASAIYKNIKALQIKNEIDAIEGITADNIAEQNFTLAKSYEDLSDTYSDVGMVSDALANKLHELATSGEVGRGDLEQMQAYYNQRIKLLTQSSDALDKAADAVYENTDAQLNYTGKVKDTNKNQDDQNNKIHDAIGAWTNLYEAMKEYNTYGQISYNTLNGLLQSYPELTSCLVQNGDELTINTTKLRDLIEKQLMLEVSQEDATNTADEYTRMLKWLDENAMSDTLTLAELKDMIEGVGAAMDEGQQKGQDYGNAIKTAVDEVVSYNPADEGFFNQEHIDKIVDMQQALQGFSDIDLVSLNPDTSQLEINYEELTKATVAYLQEQVDIAKAEGDAISEAIYTATMTAIQEGDKSALEYWLETGKAIDYVDSVVDTFQQNYNTLIDITKEYNENHMLSLDSIQALMNMNPEYLECLTLEGNALKFNKEKYVDLYKAELNVLKAKMLDANASQELVEWIDRLIEAADDADYAFGATTDALQKYKDALSKLETVFDSIINLINKGLDSVKEELEDTANNLQILGDAIIDEIDDRIEALEEQRDAQNEYYDEQIKNLEDLKDAQDEAYQDQIDDLEDQKDKLDEINDEQERAIELAKLQDDLARARANKTVRKYVEGEGYIWTVDEDAIRNAEEALSDQQREWAQEDANDALDDQIDKIKEDQEAASEIIDAQIDAIKNAQQESENAIQSQIDKLQELKDKYSEVMDLIGMDWEEYQAMLQAQALAHGMTLEEMEAYLNDYKDSVTQNMKDVEEVTDTQEEIEGLQKFIETLKEVWTLISTIIDIIDLLTGGSGLLGSLKEFVGNLFGGGDGETEGEGVEGTGGNVFEGLIDNAKGFFSNLKDTFKKGFDNVLEDLSNFNWNTYESITKFFTDTKTGIQGFVETAKGFFSNGWDGISQGIQSFIQGAKSLFDNGWGNISQGVQGFLQTVTGFFQNGFPNLSNIANNFIQSVTSFFSSGFPNLTNIANSFVSNISTLFNGGFSNILSTVTSFISNLSSSFNGGLNNIVNTAIQLLGSITSGGGGGGGSTGGTVVSGGGSVANTVSSGIGTATSIAGAVANFASGNIVGGIVSSVSAIANGIDFIKNIFKLGSGSKSVKKSNLYNVDELGPELLVRKPAQGRYTYLEAGDGVVPADMTKNIFSMAKDPDDWFKKQLGKFGNVTNTASTSSITNISMGNIVISQPVGSADQLARAIKQELPNKFKQELNKR